ncbi:unnamed protein product [Caenorhabditis angaria]|uniref:UDP-glucuronosyltransferase n=1 Tax=Caenorhabditis angaria TaxID=860376 RepID=A0A9P1I5D0_9PELO|nr:unnamed protein product [Caenorhabditis angaria]
MIIHILLAAFYIENCISFNILVYSPAFANSHQNFMGHLADTLTDAGHNVTLVVPIADEGRRNVLGIKTTKQVVFIELDEIAKKEIVAVDSSMTSLWTEVATAEDTEKNFFWFTDLMEKTCANVMRSKTLLDELKSKDFDVAIIEPLSVCGLGLFRKLGIEKTILSTSCAHYDFLFPWIGEPNHPSYVPATTSPTNDKMTIRERFENYKYYKYMRDNMEILFDKEEQLYKKYYGDEISTWKELLPSASMYFTNSNPFIDFPRPVIQKTIPIGGISVNMDHILSQKLPKEWDEILDLRPKTMLISFGSMVKSHEMPDNWKSNLLKVIKSLPSVTFIWKYESSDTEWSKNVSNVYFSRWIPQTALLVDNRVSAFLTHGGLGSVNELAHCGKPALMIPIFADQTRNSKMLARHNGSIYLDKHELGNYEVIYSAISSILFDESYNLNAQRLAQIIANQPVKPKDLVIQYTEFVAKHGPFPTMDPYVRNLNFIQKHCLDCFFLYYSSYIISKTAVIISVSIVVFKITNAITSGGCK